MFNFFIHFYCRPKFFFIKPTFNFFLQFYQQLFFLKAKVIFPSPILFIFLIQLIIKSLQPPHFLLYYQCYLLFILIIYLFIFAPLIFVFTSLVQLALRGIQVYRVLFRASILTDAVQNIPVFVLFGAIGFLAGSLPDIVRIVDEYLAGGFLLFLYSEVLVADAVAVKGVVLNHGFDDSVVLLLNDDLGGVYYLEEKFVEAFDVVL